MAELLYNFLERNYSLPKEILSAVMSLKNRAPDCNASSLTRLPSRAWMVARKGEHFTFISLVCFLRSSLCSSILSNSVWKCYCLDCRFHLSLRLPSLHCRVGKVKVHSEETPQGVTITYICDFYLLNALL